MHRLVIISSHFPPRQSAGVYRTLRFARYLPELDWDVHVLTVDPDSYEDGAKIDEGLSAKVPDQVTVHPAAAIYPMEWLTNMKGRLTPTKAKQNGRPANSASTGKKTAQNGNTPTSLFQRMKDAVTLPLMTPDRTIGWIPFAVSRGTRVIRQHNIDVIYSSGPPWSNHLIGLRLNRKTGRPWVADFRDPWVGSDFRPQRQADTWLGRKHRRLERDVVEAADIVISNTDRARSKMLTRHADLPADKFVVIPNGYDPADYENISPTTNHDTPRKLVFTHAGSFYGKRNISSFIEALGNVCQRGEIPRDEISVKLIGAKREGRSTEDDQIQRAGLQDVVELLPGVPHEECLNQLSTSDVLLLVQTEAPMCIPGKVFEYIALGKSIFTLTGEGATADLVRQEQLGPCVNPDDVPAIETALIDVYQRFKANKPLPTATPETFARYDGRRLTAELDTVLRRVLTPQETCLQLN